MPSRIIRNFTLSAGTLLAIMGFSLFLSNWVSPEHLVPPQDPLLGFSMRSVFWTVGGIALAVSLVCLFDNDSVRPLLLLSWFGSTYILYRIGLWTEGCHSTGGLLSGFSYAFRLSARMADVISAGAFGWVLLGGVVCLVLVRRYDPEKENAGLLKTICPSCGTRMKFDKALQGQETLCPKCRASVTLRGPEDLKMSCYFCKAHVRFPPHALGTKIQCPHCKMDITLKADLHDAKPGSLDVQKRERIQC